MQPAQQQAVFPGDRPYLGIRVTSALKTYRNEELANLSPVEVINRLYAIAIQAIKKNDFSLANKAVNELIHGLNFEHQEMALTLFRLYQYAKHCLRKGNAGEAAEVLQELRSAWCQAFNL